MAHSLLFADFVVRVLEPGLEAAERAYQALEDLGAVVTVPGGLPGKQYLILVTGIPANRMDITTWLKECGVELI